MKVAAEQRLFWFFKDGCQLDLSVPSQLDLYVQQVLTAGRLPDITAMLRLIKVEGLASSFPRIRRFLPVQVSKFWEHFLEDHQPDATGHPA